MKKKNYILFLIIFIGFFVPQNLFSNETFEDYSREKKLGLEQKDKDSESIAKGKLIRFIEINNIQKIEEYLKKNGNNINFNINGLNPFVHAAHINNFEIIKFFINTTEVNIDVEDELGNTALIKAAERGNIEIAEFLISKGANINYQNKSGLTPAMKAVEENHYYFLEFFLQYDIDQSKSDYSGRTIKDLANNSRDKRILKLLN